MLSTLLKGTLRLTETKCVNLTHNLALGIWTTVCKSPKAEILTQTQPQTVTLWSSFSERPQVNSDFLNSKPQSAPQSVNFSLALCVHASSRTLGSSHGFGQARQATTELCPQPLKHPSHQTNKSKWCPGPGVGIRKRMLTQYVPGPESNLQSFPHPPKKVVLNNNKSSLLRMPNSGNEDGAGGPRGRTTVKHALHAMELSTGIREMHSVCIIRHYNSIQARPQRNKHAGICQYHTLISNSPEPHTT